MNNYLESFFPLTVSKLADNLKGRNIDFQFCANRAEAKKAVLEYIRPQMSVGYGGSQTLIECGFPDCLRDMDITLFDRAEEGITKEEKKSREKKALHADVFLSGVNAISMDGCLHFIDAIGNRAAPILFGPDKIVLVAGVNKLCPDKDYAEKRMRFISCPSNAVRLQRNTPCVHTGLCSDCRSSGRICAYKIEIEYNLSPGRIHLILINEELGL